MHRVALWIAAALLCSAPCSGVAADVALQQPDGKLLTIIDDGSAGPFHQQLERRNADGTLDTRFGNNGRVSFSLGPESFGATALRLDSRGRLLVGGVVFESSDRSVPVIMRFLPDGLPDDTWGPQARRQLPSQESNLNYVDLQPMADDGAASPAQANAEAPSEAPGMAVFSPFASSETRAMPAVGADDDSSGWLLGVAGLLSTALLAAWWTWRKPRAGAQPTTPAADRQVLVEAAINAIVSAAQIQPTPLKSADIGPSDDLKRIKGIGPVIEEKLHCAGTCHFWQIAQWTHEDIARIEPELTRFKGRIERDAWVSQAQALACRPTRQRFFSASALMQ